MASTSAMSPALLGLLLALCSTPALLGGVSSVSSSRSSSGPEARRHLLDVRPHQRGLASESVHVVSLNQRRSAALTEPEVIDEVDDVTVRVLSARSVLIAWVDPLVQKKKEIPAGSRFYTVRFREKGESARWEQRDSAQRRLLLESLAADSMYEFSVRISHAGQQGQWSASVFQRTPESVPSGPPEHFQVKPLGGKGTVVTATWNPPEQSNGRVREYILSYAPASKPFGSKSVTYPGTTTSATVDALAPGERYIFKVRAVNRKGHGPQTKAVTVQTPASSTSSSRTSSNKSDSKDSEDMNLPHPDRDTRTGTQTSPVRRRGRPLSQTRSYHSIFSSVRGSNRELGSKAPDSLSTQTNPEDGHAGNTHRSTDPLAEETIAANEAFVSAKPASDVDLKHSSNTEPSTKPSIQRVKQATGSRALADADEKPRSQRPSWTPRTSSIVDISKIKRPNSRNHGQIIPAQERGTARSPSSSPSPAPTHSFPLSSGHSAFPSPSTPLTSSGARRSPSTSGRLTGSPSGSLNPNSRKVGISSRFHRLLTGQRRPAPPSSTGPHSASPTGSTINLPHTTQEPDTEPENKKRSVTKEEQSESTDNSNIPTVRPSDKTAPSPGRGSASVNQHSRTAGGSRRQDGRVPWSRTASSVGAGRPNIRGLPSHPAFPRSQNTDEKSTRDVDSPVWIKPSTANRAAGSTNSVGSSGSDDVTPESVKSEEISAVTVSHRASLTSVPLAGVNDRNNPPVVSSRSHGSRLSNRLSHVKHRRPSSASNDFVPSYFSAPSSSSSQNISAIDQDIAVNSADAGLFAGSSFKPPSAGNGSRNRLPHTGHQPRLRKVKHGRPNLTAVSTKLSSPSDESTKPSGVKQITGPDGAKWVIDLDKGVLMTENGRILQDSSGKPRKVVLGEDGKMVFDEQGSPLVNSEGLALFGHGRDSRPVVNPNDKYLTLGGKPIVGLDRAKPRVSTTILPEPAEATSAWAAPTCPPGSYSRLDTNGSQIVDAGGILNCYSEGDVYQQTTALPLPTPPARALSRSPTSERDAAGRRRFTAPYVNYVQKDPGAPCSLTEALEYLQVDVLAQLMEKDQQPPKNKPHNVTVVAMEGCHSFVILDWARPLKDDMVSGYMVQSASYDDVLNNRWSTRASSGTHLPVENLKPNSRYYFRVQAKNVVGLGPVSETLTYVTESDDPLLIERPPGGEPVWVPFSFRFNAAHSSCKGSQFVKRTWYRKFVGVVLCNSLRYKIFMSDGLRETFYSVADSAGHGEDHCQFVDSHLEGRTGRHELSDGLPTAQGFFRSDRQEPVRFGPVGKRTPHPFVGWYECGVPIPGKW